MYLYLTDSWSPDLEDASDARQDGAKLTYGRDFLLQFQTNPLSMMKPEGLPDIDVVLVQARPPSKSGSQQNRYSTIVCNNSWQFKGKLHSYKKS